MKNLIKCICLLLAFAAGSVQAQYSTSPTARFMPLLSGYNVYVPSNSVVGYGSTNVLNTTYAGQIIRSLTNNTINGTANTNLVAPDAFKLVGLQPNAVGDYTANAAVVITLGNTNLLPIAVTNSVGQWFIPSMPYTTNYATAAWATTWPLAPSPAPNWMYPATTNIYPAFTATATNLITVTLYRSAWSNPSEATTGPKVYTWETTSSFSFSVNANGVTPVTVLTNLPAAWLLGARHVYATVTANNVTANTSGVLINQLGIVQPQP